MAHASHGTVDLYQPWQLLNRLIHWHPVSPGTDALALIVTVALAVLLVWRLPAGLPGSPGCPAGARAVAGLAGLLAAAAALV